MVSAKALPSMVPISSAAERPPGVSEERRTAAWRPSAAAGSSTARNTSPGARAVRPGPTTRCSTGTRRSPPSGHHSRATPSMAVASATMGAAGKARQMLPPTVAIAHTLKEPSSAWQQGSTMRRARCSGAQVVA